LKDIIQLEENGPLRWNMPYSCKALLWLRC